MANQVGSALRDSPRLFHLDDLICSDERPGSARSDGSAMLSFTSPKVIHVTKIGFIFVGPYELIGVRRRKRAEN